MQRDVLEQDPLSFDRDKREAGVILNGINRVQINALGFLKEPILAACIRQMGWEMS